VVKCQVRCCNYLAEIRLLTPAGALRVCPLHAAPQVSALVAQGKQPHAYWSCGRPIVLPCGPLEVVVVEGDFGRAFDDPLLTEIDDRPTRLVGKWCDLTRGR